MRLPYLCILILGFTTLVMAQSPDELKKGDRFKPLTDEQLTPQQKAVLAQSKRAYEIENRAQGRTNAAPLTVDPQKMANIEMSTIYPGIRSPEVMSFVLDAISYLRVGALPRPLHELAVLLVGRWWTAQYEFQSHYQHAARMGLSKDIIDAIAAGKRPPTMKPDEEAAYNFAAELLQNQRVSDQTFEVLKNKFGEAGVVELIGAMSIYDYVSMLHVVDRFPVPDKNCLSDCEFVGKPLLQPLKDANLGVATTDPAETVNDFTKGDRFQPLKFEQLVPLQQALLDKSRHMYDVESGRCYYTDQCTSGDGGGTKPLPFTVSSHIMANHDLIDNHEMSAMYEGVRSPQLTQYMFYALSKMRTGAVPRKLQEVAVLIVARSWTDQYEFQSHHGYAKEAGLSENVIEAIAAGVRPTSMKPDEEAVYNFCTQLLQTHEVTDKTFDALKSRLGSEQGVAEVIGTMAIYDYISMLNVVDRFPLPDGVMPELKALKQ